MGVELDTRITASSTMSMWEYASPAGNYQAAQQAALAQVLFLTQGGLIAYISCRLDENLCGDIIAFTDSLLVVVSIATGDFANVDRRKVTSVVYPRSAVSALEMQSISDVFVERGDPWPKRLAIRVSLGTVTLDLPLDQRPSDQNFADLAALYPSLLVDLAA